MHDYDNPFHRRNPFKSRTSEKVKNFFIISAVVLVLGGGICGFTYLMLESGYGMCLVVRCVKILP